MTRDCVHGQLARSCNICEIEERCDRLACQVERLALRCGRLESAVAHARTWIDCSGHPEKNAALDALDRVMGPILCPNDARNEEEK